MHFQCGFQIGRLLDVMMLIKDRTMPVAAAGQLVEAGQ